MKTTLLALTLALLFFGYLSAQTPFGMAVSMDGEGDYVLIEDAPELTPSTNSITIEAWIYKNTFGDISENILTKYNSWAGGAELSWTMVALNNGQLRFGVYESFSTWHVVDTDSAVIPENAWVHVAGTFDFNTHESYIYINGIEVAAPLVPGSSTISAISDSETPVHLGAIIPVSGILTGFWNGNLDEVRIWNFARSINQINATMNDTLSSTYYSTADSGLVACWRFDALEDLGVSNDGADDVRDLSVYGHHGDLVNDSHLAPSGVLVGIRDENTNIPEEYVLEQNYPNPFNPSTFMSWQLPVRSNIKLTVYDLSGRKVRELVNGSTSAGVHQVIWDGTSDSGRSVASGVYIYKLSASSGFVQAKKMILLR